MTDQPVPSPKTLTRRDLSMDMAPASVYGTLIMLPLAAAFYFAFRLHWGAKPTQSALDALLIPNWRGGLLMLLALVLGTLMHEALHAIGWVYLGKKSWRSIKFGLLLATLTPYAHCKEPLEVGAYRGGAALPGALVGVLPTIVAILIGNFALLVFGLIFTVAAGGDALILWLIRGVKRGALVEDHTTRAGCYIVEPNPQS